MKKLKKALTATLLTAVMAIMLIAMASCGAQGTLAFFVTAVKSGNLDKAEEYVSGDILFTYSYDKDDEVAAYIYKKTIGSFSYKVTNTEDNTDDSGEVVSTTLTISYSAYSYTELKTKMGITSFLTDVTKTKVDAALEDMSKTEGETKVIIVKDDEGNWKLEAVTANALAVLMGTPISK